MKRVAAADEALEGVVIHTTGESMSRRPKLTHRLEYLGLLAVAGVLRFLPERLGLRVSEALGVFAGVVLRVRRRVVDENLRRALPQKTQAVRDRIAVSSYRHLAREGSLLLKSTLRPMSPRQVRERSYWADTSSESTFQSLKDRADRGQATLVLTGHLGNWEMAGAALSALVSTSMPWPWPNETRSSIAESASTGDNSASP